MVYELIFVPVGTLNPLQAIIENRLINFNNVCDMTLIITSNYVLNELPERNYQPTDNIYTLTIRYVGGNIEVFKKVATFINSKIIITDEQQVLKNLYNTFKNQY